MKSDRHHFYCLGECMVEFAPAGDGLFRQSFAGDTFNTAWYLRQLLPTNGHVAYLTAIGQDRVSDALLDFMDEAGIDHRHIHRSGDATLGAYLIHLDRGERSFSYWRSTSAARHAFEHLPTPEAIGGHDAVLHISGISLAIAGVDGRAVLEDYCAQLRRLGTLISFDPNMRPPLWESADAMRAAVLAMAATSDVVLPSLDEEQAYFGPGDADGVCARYHQQGAGTVVVKNGDGPMLISTSHETPLTVMPSPVADIVDTTAAGDSFNAGFLAARGMGAANEDAALFGARTAARVIQGRGALVDVSGLK